LTSCFVLAYSAGRNKIWYASAMSAAPFGARRAMSSIPNTVEAASFEPPAHWAGGDDDAVIAEIEAAWAEFGDMPRSYADIDANG